MAMSQQHKVWVFYYGSNINFDVLKQVGMVPDQWEVARAPGFDIRIGPHANLVRSERDTAWGINATGTHAELARLYGGYVQGKLGQIYLPEAIITYTADGTLRPALTYICHDMAPGVTDVAYIDKIIEPARRFNFPDWYIERLQSFRPR